MPVTKSAIKKARQDLKKTARNRLFKSKLKSAIRSLLKSTTKENFQTAQSLIDRAIKKGIYKKNKAARLKSQLAKLLIKRASSRQPTSSRKKKVRSSKSQAQTNKKSSKNKS